jgi:hypothetical protein
MKRYLIFFPLLIFYIIKIIIFNNTELGYDELRYLNYAKNLTNGFFADPVNPHLESGPGYPLFLSIFLLFHCPLIYAKIANGFFIYFGLIFFNRSLQVVLVEKRYAFYATIILGLYYPMYYWMNMLFTESLTFFLICCLMFLFA